METKVINIGTNYNFKSKEFLDLAKDVRNGSLIAFPTETVYGLGANCTLENSIDNIFKVKGRPSDNPLIIHIANKSDIYKYGENISLKAELLINAFWPGPLTLVVNKKAVVPSKTSGGLMTVGIRFPSNIVARELIKEVGVPIAAPSANLSGKPSTTSGQHVIDDLYGMVEYIITSSNSEIGLESTIIDVTKEIPELLRPGNITIEKIEKIIGEIKIDSSIINSKERVDNPKAPGMKYKHYSPKGDLFLYIGNNKYEGILKDISKTNKKFGVICSKENYNLYSNNEYPVVEFGSQNNLEDVSKNIYACLRQCDDLELEEIYCEGFTKVDLGLTIMNRLEKASKFIICT